jgi:hypothetical protein
MEKRVVVLMEVAVLHGRSPVDAEEPNIEIKRRGVKNIYANRRGNVFFSVFPIENERRKK